MRKTGRTKALLAMFLAAASLQAGTAFGAQAATGSQLQAGTWVKEDAGWKYRKPSGEMATGWVHTASGWYYLQLPVYTLSHYRLYYKSWHFYI